MEIIDIYIKYHINSIYKIIFFSYLFKELHTVTVVTKKCNSPGNFRLVVFLAVFFQKFDKKSQNLTVRGPGVTVRESLL